MVCMSLPGFLGVVWSCAGTNGRFDFNGRKTRKNRLNTSPSASSSLLESPNSSRSNIYKEVLQAARDKFTREISFRSKDKDISLAKALLYVAAEDEAYLAYNRQLDTRCILNERKDISPQPESSEWDSLEGMPLGGKNINEWLAELDSIAKEVEAEMVPKEIGCDLVEVLEAVNKVLFESRGFKRLPVLVDSRCSYLHSVLSSGRASAILLSVIYIEVCQRLNLMIVGSRVGEDFLIWPPTGNPEDLFKVISGHSLFGIVNGKCVDDPWSRASDINSNSLLGLDIATNRDIVGIALANLIRLYWKRASRTNHGLMLTSPLNKNCGPNMPLLRPQELRLAMMASDRLLILQPHNWALRRDYGMMLYYNREYEAAVQELSICMAFAPEDEAEVLEAFVEKLHLMRIETSWTESLRVLQDALSLRENQLKQVMAFPARIFGNKCRALMAAAKSTPAVSAAAEVPKAPPRPTGILRVQPVSPALAKFLGSAEASRSDAVKQIWAYVKSNNLQNPDNKREIYCDDKLKAIFDGNDKVNFQGVAKLLSTHFPKTK